MTPEQVKKQATILNQAINSGSKVQHFDCPIQHAVARGDVLILVSNYGNEFKVDKISNWTIDIFRPDDDYLRCDSCGCFLKFEDNAGIDCSMCPDCAKEIEP